MYVEGLDRGAAFIEAVKRAEGRKPSVILKGGMTDQGRRSAVSHTGALATDGRIWQGLAAQFGLVLERSIEDFVGTLVGFSHWLRGPRHAGRRCCLVGPGGVLSVLGTDLLRRHGLDVPALDGGALERLEALRLPPGSSVRNPIDTPVGVMQAQGGRAFGHILRVVAESGAIDWFVVHVSIQNLFSYLADPETALESSIAGFLDVAHEFRERARWGLVLRTNGDPALDPVSRRPRTRSPPSSRGRSTESVWREAREMTKVVPFGLSTGVYPHGFPDGSWFARLFEQMEAWGFDDVVCYVDRPTWPHPVLDPLVLLSIAAATTRRARLFGMVIATQWVPLLLAKQVASIDYISGGRLTLGLALGGDYPKEMQACGVAPAERVARLEEAIAVMRGLWSGAPVTRKGRFQTLDETVQLPRPPQPAIPLWLAHRARSAASIRRTALLADGWLRGSARAACGARKRRSSRSPGERAATSRASRSAT